MLKQKQDLVQKIKETVAKMLLQAAAVNVTFSVYISEQMGYNYTYLSDNFKKVEGITLEQYIINCKIEKVKQMLIDNKILPAIAAELNYSSSAAVCNQFKKITGITTGEFKKQHEKLKPEPVAA